MNVIKYHTGLQHTKCFVREGQLSLEGGGASTPDYLLAIQSIFAHLRVYLHVCVRVRVRVCVCVCMCVCVCAEQSIKYRIVYNTKITVHSFHISHTHTWCHHYALLRYRDGRHNAPGTSTSTASTMTFIQPNPTAHTYTKTACSIVD